MTSDTTAVWMLEVGVYSGYRVVGIYSSEANAKLVADKLGPEVSIVRRVLDPLADEINEGRSPWWVVMTAVGYVIRCRELGGDLSVHAAFCGLSRHPLDGQVSGSVWATDREHAIEITNEYRVRKLAES